MLASSPIGPPTFDPQQFYNHVECMLLGLPDKLQEGSYANEPLTLEIDGQTRYLTPAAVEKAIVDLNIQFDGELTLAVGLCERIVGLLRLIQDTEFMARAAIATNRDDEATLRAVIYAAAICPMEKDRKYFRQAVLMAYVRMLARAHPAPSQN